MPGSLSSSSSSSRIQLAGLARTAQLRAALGLVQDGPASEAPAAIEQLPFFATSDEATVELLRDAFGTELQRLKVASPTAEVTVAQPLGNLGCSGDQTPSRLIYGADYAEVNRSIVGVLALKWLVRDDYESFASCQRAETRLRQRSFDAMRRCLLSYLRSSVELYALIIATFANDLGKDASMHDEIQAYLPPGTSKVNHDEVIYLAAINDDVEIINEFPRASPIRDALILGLKLGAKLNIAQFTQAENVPGSLASLQVMQGNKAAFDLKFLEIILDVAGAQGHNDARGAVNMTEAVWTSYAKARDILLGIVSRKVSCRAGYDTMLSQRAAVLAGDGFQTLDVQTAPDRALLRLLCMGRVTTVRMASVFAQALDSLTPAIKQRLVAGLSVDGIFDGPAVIPYNAPSLFANALNRTRDVSERRCVEAIAALLRLLARAYHGSTPRPDLQCGKVVECYLDFARPWILTDAFSDSPDSLDALPVPESAYSEAFKDWDAGAGA